MKLPWRDFIEDIQYWIKFDAIEKGAFILKSLGIDMKLIKLLKIYKYARKRKQNKTRPNRI